MIADVREGGRWSLAQRTKNDALVGLVSAALLIGRLPTPLLVALGKLLGRAVHALSPKLRSLAETQLAQAFPTREACDARALARASFVALGGELGAALSMTRSPPPLLPFPAAERAKLDAAIAGGRGVVLASAHLGPFERVAATLDETFPDRFVVVGRESYDPRLMEVYRRLRRYETVYRGAPGAGVRMMRVLRRGAVLGIPMDLKTRAPSVLVPFLGAHSPTALGPARLALRSGAAVVVATVEPGSGVANERDASSTLAVGVTRIATGDLVGSTEGVTELTARINAELGRRIAALPTLWPWMHRRR